jgi:hypothetical protein
MKKIIIFAFFIFQLILTGSTLASSYKGKVAAINVREEDGLVWVYITGERTGDRPSCATNWYMVIKNENSPSGKRQFAMLLMAKATKSVVLIEGAKTCNRWGDAEDISFISIE